MVWLDLYWWSVAFGFLKFSNPPLTLWVLSNLLSNVEMFIPSFLYILDADITPKDPQMGQGGLQDAPGAV